MPNSVALTAPTLGTAYSPSSLSFSNVRSIKFDYDHQVVEIVHGTPSQVTYIDNDTQGATTFTITTNEAAVAISWS